MFENTVPFCSKMLLSWCGVGGREGEQAEGPIETYRQAGYTHNNIIKN